MKKNTIESQYQSHADLKDRQGLSKLGIEKNGNWHEDPKRLLFVLSRYKFAARMLSGSKRVLEVGCGDGWPIRIVLQEVEEIHGIDIDPLFIEDIEARVDPKWPFKFFIHDILSGPLKPIYDAAYSLDVLEHITPENEHKFIKNIVASLSNKGILLIGTPSLQSQIYASQGSRIGHINCKTAQQLKVLLNFYFDHVFIFSMNDEIVHTGYHPMAHYLFGLCTGIKSNKLK
jgi:2-polyprenyl-3-methyl-5-hydroxy-6-metoxy-1,4-benzoquinol methylase